MFAIKLFGALLICICGFSLGYKKSQLCTKRAKTLSLMSNYLQDIRSFIKYKRDNTVTILCQISKMEKYYPLHIEFNSDNTPDWPLKRKIALQCFSEQFSNCLLEDEINYFCQAIENIGSTNAQQEDEKLMFYNEKLQEYFVQAQESALKNRKLYIGLGLFAGIGVAIIML